MPESDSILEQPSPSMQQFIKAAKTRGYCSYEALLGVLPGDEFTTEQIDEVVATLSEVGIKVLPPRGEPQELYSFASSRPPHVEPSLEQIEPSEPPYKAVVGASPFMAEPGLDGRQDRDGRRTRDLAKAADVRRYISDVDTRQGMFLSASGTLTQFNAILAAILGASLTTVELSVLKVSITAALLLHVLAAFILCWAARPVAATAARVQPNAFVVTEHYRHADHTFRNYRRGWRMTIAAFAVSSVAAVLFVLHSFGIVVPDLLAVLR